MGQVIKTKPPLMLFAFNQSLNLTKPNQKQIFSQAKLVYDFLIEFVPEGDSGSNVGRIGSVIPSAGLCHNEWEAEGREGRTLGDTAWGLSTDSVLGLSSDSVSGLSTDSVSSESGTLL